MEVNKMKKKIMIVSILLFIMVVAITSVALVLYFNSNKVEVLEDIYQPIPEIPADEIISMDEDPLASIKQNMEYYDQFSREELDNAKKYYDMKKVESAIFVYNYVEEDLMSEAPDWVSNDVIREYSSTYDGFVMDDFMSACFQTITKCCEKYGEDIADINMYCGNNGEIVFTVNGSEYYLYMALDLPHEGYKYTIYVVPVEN